MATGRGFFQREQTSLKGQLNMTKTQLMLLRSYSPELIQYVRDNGPVLLPHVSIPIVLSQSPTIQPVTGRVPLSRESVREVERSLALSCTYEDYNSSDAIRHQLQCVIIAFQLVKPTSDFLNLWIQLDSSNMTEMATRDVSDLGKKIGPEPYLNYQQHNCLTKPDVDRAFRLLPNLDRALERNRGSWKHPLVAIHRALVFFCQGYTVSHRDLKQFLWAAGLDSLYASKLVKAKQSSKEIGRRMQQFLGADLKLYEAETVSVPESQVARKHEELKDVVGNIFRLRNALAHGLCIPVDAWLSAQDQPLESGYAYQLIEQTEIALRLTLIKLLEDHTFFDVFSDAARLDAYF